MSKYLIGLDDGHTCLYCDSKPQIKGMCSKHYKQMYRHGKILTRTIHDKNEFIIKDNYAIILIYDKQGNRKTSTKIDLEDVDTCKKYKWCESRGYIITSINGRKHRLSRLLLNPSKDKVVDHINGDTLDNRRENLRICTIEQNTYNQKINSANTSDVKGVSFDKTRNKWRAYITVDDKQIYLGRFDTKEEAFHNRKKAEIKYFGEYSREYRKEVI